MTRRYDADPNIPFGTFSRNNLGNNQTCSTDQYLGLCQRPCDDLSHAWRKLFPCRLANLYQVISTPPTRAAMRLPFGRSFPSDRGGPTAKQCKKYGIAVVSPGDQTASGDWKRPGSVTPGKHRTVAGLLRGRVVPTVPNPIQIVPLAYKMEQSIIG